MIRIFKTRQNGFALIDGIEGKCWINVSNPNPAELEKLSGDHHIPIDFLTDPLDSDEGARIETDEDTVFIIIRAPKLDHEKKDVPFTTLPIGIILTKNLIITVCASDIIEILDLLHSRSKTFSTENRRHFILNLFLKTSSLYLKYLKEINRRNNEIETELHRSMKNEELIKLLNLEKSLVFFTTSLKSNELMMEKLQKVRLLELSEDDRELLDDVIIDNKQAIETANIYSNILSGMMDAFASVISNNLNIAIKFLTSITIILMIPTFMASLYGMNVELPFQHSPHAFLINIGISFTLTAIGVLIFWRKKWF